MEEAKEEAAERPSTHKKHVVSRYLQCDFVIRHGEPCENVSNTRCLID